MPETAAVKKSFRLVRRTAPSIGGPANEKQTIDYTRRGLFGNIAGRGFDPRRLHHRWSRNAAQANSGPEVHPSGPLFCATYRGIS